MLLCGNNLICDVLVEVKKKFSSLIDLKSINWQKIVDHLALLDYEDCYQHQELLIKSTVLHPVIQKYPIKVSYQKEFLKICIKKIEDANIAVNDLVYETLINLLSTNNENIHFRHFILNKDRYLILKENTCFISQGTTGLCTWQGGIALANWAIRHNTLLNGKHILELGCGIGLTGLAIILSGVSPKTYTFSDCHPLVLNNLKENINLNNTTTSLEQENCFPKLIEGVQVDVLNLEWDTISNVKSNVDNVDLILAADVVYDAGLCRSLCKAISYIIGNTNKYAIIACTERDPQTFKTFKQILGDYLKRAIN